MKIKVAFLTSLLMISPFSLLAQDYSPHLSAINGAINVTQNSPIRSSYFQGRRVLVMFWKYDCAPCRVEVRNFAAIRRAAGNMPILLIAPKYTNLEKGALKPALENGAIVATKADFLNTLEELGDPEGGVPYSVMFDEAGVACISNLGPTDAKSISQMKRACD